MNEEAKEDYIQARPYLLLLTALAIHCSRGNPTRTSHENAEEFLQEFEKRNEIQL